MVRAGRPHGSAGGVSAPDRASSYAINSVVQAYYDVNVALDELVQLLSSYGGLGYHSVSGSRMLGDAIDLPAASMDFVNPVPQGRKSQSEPGSVFESCCSTPACSCRELGWEIVPSFVHAEVRYSAVTLRNQQSGERTIHLYGTPGLRFSY